MQVLAVQKSNDVLLSSTLKGLNVQEEDKAILAALFNRSGDSVETYIPSNIDGTTMRSWLESSARIRSWADDVGHKIKPIMGQMFMVVKKRPDLMEGFGCKSFTDFMNRYVPENLHMSSPDAWAAHRMIRDQPGLSSSEYEAVGTSNLNLIAKAVPNTPGQDELDPDVLRQRRELLEVAKGLATEKGPASPQKLAEKIQEMGIAQKNEIMQGLIKLYCDDRLASAWEAHCEHPAIVAHCGSNSPTAIFEAMLGECHAMWVAEYGAEFGGE